MRALSWVVVGLAACAGGGGGAGKGGAGDDDDDDTTGPSPWPDTCVYAGVDAPPRTPYDGTYGDFEGFATYEYVPADARALILYFHGGGTVDEITQTEQLAIFQLFASEGFGVIATQRTLPGEQANWDAYSDFSRNDDAQRVERFVADVRARYDVPDLPLVMDGFSDGGVMAMGATRIFLERDWPIMATMVHSAAFTDLAADVPTMFVQGENDYDNIADEIVARLHDDGIVAETRVHPERVTTPEVFLRLPGMDLPRAQAAFDDLVALHVVDEAGVRVPSDAAMEPALGAWARNTTIPGASAIEMRMRVIWATHRVNGYDAADQCRFLVDALP